MDHRKFLDSDFILDPFSVSRFGTDVCLGFTRLSGIISTHALRTILSVLKSKATRGAISRGFRERF